MKRRREAETVASEIKLAIEELSTKLTVNARKTCDFKELNNANEDCDSNNVHVHHQLPLKPFLSLCNLQILVLDKIGPTMAVLRHDIEQNIQRLEKFHDSDPSTYWDLFEIIKKEISEGKAKKGPTCSKAFVWLIRSLDFTLSLLQRLGKDFDTNMELAVEESYNITLKTWHGWISSAAYKVALKLVPDSQTLVSILKAKDDEDNCMLREDIETLVSLLGPFLQETKDILKAYGLDKLKSA